MEIELERRYLSVYKPSGSGSKTLEVSSDVIVPDTKADILRIVLSDCKYRIVSKDNDNGRVRICGELNMTAAYTQDGNAEISSLITAIPFECDFDDESVNASCSTVADIDILSFETRIINTRKLLCKASVRAGYRAFCIDETEWYEAPAERPEGVYFKTESVKAILIDNVCEKNISLEDEFNIDEAGDSAELIYASYVFKEQTADAVGSKLVVKGRVTVSIVYHESGVIRSVEKSAGYSQIFDISERDTVPDHTVTIVPTGDYFVLNDSVLSYEIHAVMQMISSNEKVINCISDGYACKSRLAADTGTMNLITNIKKEKQTEKITMCHTDENGIEKICFVKSHINSVSNCDEGVRVSAFADIVYFSGGELKGVRVYNQECFRDIDRGEISAEITSARAEANGNTIDITAEIQFITQAGSCENIEMIISARTEDDECSEEKAPLYLVRPDDLWTLAKKYRSDVEQIKKLNGIEDEGKIENRLLLIPTIV